MPDILQRAWTVWEPAVMLPPYPVGFTGRFFLQRALKLPPWAPHPADIVAAKMWAGGALPHAQGLWQVLIDRGGEYTKGTHFPATQTCAFGAPSFRCSQHVHVLADFELATGNSIGPAYMFSPPVRIYPEDKLIMATEGGMTDGAAGTYITPLWSLSWIDGVSPVPPAPPPSSTVAFSATLDTSNNAPDISLRNILPISVGGNRARVTLAAGTGGTLTCRFASMGVHSGNLADTVAEPVELPFAGKSGFQIAAGTSIVSDWIELNTSAGQSVVVVLDLEPSFDAIATLGHQTYWYRWASTYAEEQPRDLSLYNVPCGVDTHTHAVQKIEVGSI